MLHALFAAALVSLVASTETPLEVGTQLTYRGSVAAAQDPQDQKTFDLSLWILSKGESGAELFWLVEERSRGELPWPNRFGRASLDPRWRASAGGPKLLYDRGESRSYVPLLMPFLAPEKPLAAGGEFEDGKLQFHVDKATKAAERPAWHLSVRDAFGPKRTLRVDQNSPLVLTMKERLTMGQGVEYQLNLEFVSAEQLAGERLAALARAVERLTLLRGKLNLPAESHEIIWKDEQLALLGKELPPIAETAAGTPLSKVTEAAARDLKLQSGRSDAVATLSSKFEGQAVEAFAGRTSDNQEITLDNLKGHVTVLHFWDYRDEPLREPYGQVGYLDFMYHRRQAAGMQLFGVAVDGRLNDEKTRPAAERSVKKLKAFMNLSYPVILDSGKLLKQFGDPRVVGANLPLFVVIGPDAKIMHYHVGTYEVNQDQGLKELDQVVGKALEKR